MRSDYAQILQSAEAVGRYLRVVYAPQSYSGAVNARQRWYLRRLLRASFPHRRPVHHDFACGAGRAIRLLHGVVREAHGYDVSAAMLARAREANRYARLHEVAPDGPLPVPATTAGPAVVTVFRLLLDGGEEVRDRAIGFAARVLPYPDSGLLVVENHGNRTSLRHLRRHRHADDGWFAELSHEQVVAVLARHGFRVVARRGFALCPPGSYRRRCLRPFARGVDDIAARLPAAAPVATNVLYVARRG